MTFALSQPSTDDVDVLSKIRPPERGTHLYGGIHVQIPEDWQDRIEQGMPVAGCTYYDVPAVGALRLDDGDVATLEDDGEVARLGLDPVRVASMRVRLSEVPARAQTVRRKR